MTFQGKFSGKVKEAAVRHLNFASKADPKTFLENVAVMATLKHDGLINLVGYCENEGEFYLVHEFIETPGTIGTVFLRKIEALICIDRSSIQTNTLPQLQVMPDQRSIL